jgi:hypothetical protein
VRADALERDIWADVGGHLHNPQKALALIAASLDADATTADSLRAQLAAKQHEQDALQGERDAVAKAFRKGLLTETDLEHQLADLAADECNLAAEAAEIAKDLAALEEADVRLSAAQTLLQTLRDRLDHNEVTPRTIIETLVEKITVRMEPGEDGKPRPVVRVRYCFDPDEITEIGVATRYPTRFVIRKDRRTRYG